MLTQERIIARLKGIDLNQLPFIPPHVSINHLDANFRLLPEYATDILTINHEHHAIYTSQKTIAKNGRTIVRIAQHLSTGKWEICKSIDPRMFNPCEIDALKQMRQFIGYVNSTFLMEYISGIRLDTLLSRAHFSHIYLNIASKLLLELQKLHQKNFAHRDLHGGNILYDIQTGKLSIIDYGRALRTDNIELKIADLQKALWHLQSCFRKTTWLKKHSTLIFKDTYAFIKQIHSLAELDLFYLRLQKKLRYLISMVGSHT